MTIKEVNGKRDITRVRKEDREIEYDKERADSDIARGKEYIESEKHVTRNT